MLLPISFSDVRPPSFALLLDTRPIVRLSGSQNSRTQGVFLLEAKQTDVFPLVECVDLHLSDDYKKLHLMLPMVRDLRKTIHCIN